MYKIYPFVTNDLSVGLFSPCDDDIYHSLTGAATEAYTKFILPANIEEFLSDHVSVRVLDICYGVGYNTKSFLNFIFQNKFKNFKKNNKNLNKLLSIYNYKLYDDNNFNCNIDKIYTNNVQNKLSVYDYNNKIYTDNNIEDFCYKTLQESTKGNIFDKNFSIYIKAIDTDKTLAFLSPFLNSKITKIPKMQYNNEKIKKIRENIDKNKNIYFDNFGLDSLIRYPLTINIMLLDSISKAYPDMFYTKDLLYLLSDVNLCEYFSKDMLHIFEFYKTHDNKFNLRNKLTPFLHNIYYKYISERHKIDLKALKSLDIDFELKINDARLEIKSDENEYDFIFLDAFTPSKCPCLWTIDFFKLLYNHLGSDGMVLTYTTSAAVRNAFISSGFFVGKIFNPMENRFTGTVAAKNKSLIKFELTEFDLGLLKTKAGIFYRDKNLTALNEEITDCRKFEVEKSSLISSTVYKKNYK